VPAKMSHSVFVGAGEASLKMQLSNLILLV